MLQNLTGWHALVILAIVLLVFGSSKLPSLARSVGQSMHILKDEMHADTPAQPARTTEPAPTGGTAPEPTPDTRQLQDTGHTGQAEQPGYVGRAAS